MTRDGALLLQARSDFAVYQHLASLDRSAMPECHALHYFQMCSEKVSKAAFGALGLVTDPFSHVAFSQIPYHMARRDAARALGYKSFHAYRAFLGRAAPLFRRVDELNPAVGLQMPAGAAKDGPNVEYPWQARDISGQATWIVPAGHGFELLSQMKRGGDAARMVDFVKRLLERFDAVFR
ncbi:MAG TPA: hypothetical protein VFC78_12510 [Tepidisphaeraceae bacterium]|nr:hypothetical protein [Tepidisphaeraceae bacterium]